MKSVWHRGRGFSLVELTLALGVAAFCLIATFGLISVGVQTNRDATSQTAATNIIALAIADMRAAGKNVNSNLLCITIGTTKTLYCDSQCQCSSDLAGTIGVCGTGSLSIKPRYQLSVTFPTPAPNNPSTTYADLKVTWPAASPTPAEPSGSVEMFAAFDRR